MRAGVSQSSLRVVVEMVWKKWVGKMEAIEMKRATGIVMGMKKVTEMKCYNTWTQHYA